MTPLSSGPLNRLQFVAAALALIVLIVTLVMGIAPNIDTRLVEVGEHLWPGYARDLRGGLPEPPQCVLDTLEQQIESCATGPDGDEAVELPSTDPFRGEDPFGGGDPFENPSIPSGGVSDEPAENAQLSRVQCEALRNLLERCKTRHEHYASVTSRVTISNQIFRAIELFVSSLARFPFWKHLLIILVSLGAFTATLSRNHIALRVARNRLEHWVSQLAQLAAHGLLFFSAVADIRVQQASSMEISHPGIPVLWAAGFLVLILVNLRHIVRPPQLGRERSTFVRLLMVMPLYAYLAIISGLYFLIVEQHPSGLAIYLHKFIEIPTIYLGVGLYIWSGILFSMTRVAQHMFGILRPLGIPPALLSWLVVVLAAVPTAYSGASGIFVMAAGAVIFHQLREAGATRRLALATTAMSGSLGVVLRPCLVVVLIATLNKQVTTTALFGKGLWVFALTSLLFLVAMLLKNDRGLRLTPEPDARAISLESVKHLLPYFGIAVAILLGYAVLFATRINEHTAAFVLPGVLIALVAYERRIPLVSAVGLPIERLRSVGLPLERLGVTAVPNAEEGRTSIWRDLVASTEASSHHIGALLMLMASSVCLGGVVERSELMSRVPDSLGTSMFLVMALLVVVMVIVGMTMDPMGAVVLVSVTLANIAYENGIDPVHFWMMVLVAFELGYLTPPVSLNHLLARQVVGAEAQLEYDRIPGVWAQYEHIFLPMAVMGAALAIVAFAPLFFYG